MNPFITEETSQEKPFTFSSGLYGDVFLAVIHRNFGINSFFKNFAQNSCQTEIYAYEIDVPLIKTITRPCNYADPRSLKMKRIIKELFKEQRTQTPEKAGKLPILCRNQNKVFSNYL